MKKLILIPMLLSLLIGTAAHAENPVAIKATKPLGLDIYIFGEIESPRFDTLIFVGKDQPAAQQWPFMTARLARHLYAGVRIEAPLFTNEPQQEELGIYIRQDVPPEALVGLTAEKAEEILKTCAVSISIPDFSPSLLRVYHRGYCHFENRDGHRVLMINDEKESPLTEESINRNSL